MAFLAQKLISASGATEETDDDFNLVTALYHFDGTNGAQNNTFLDSSSNDNALEIKIFNIVNRYLNI